MYLALGYRCNHHCFFCPCGNRDTKTSAASTDELISVIQRGIKSQHIEHITLSGGEPTLHPGFHDVLVYCLENGLSVSVLSNGDTFHNPENISRFFGNLPAGKLQITTALHSCDSSLHNRVTGQRNSFQNTVRGVMNVMSFGIPVTIKQVISAWNYRNLYAFVDFVYKTFGPQISLTLCGMDYCGMTAASIKEVAVSFKELGPYLEEALDLVMELRRSCNAFPIVTVADLPLCCVDPYYWGFFVRVSRNSVVQYSAPQDNNGIVSVDTSIPNGCDVFFKECSRCCVAELCPGIWETAYRLFGEMAVTAIVPTPPC